MKILIIDGQGGKMGALIVKKLKDSSPETDLYAVGTNSAATTAMLKAGADFGATGENAIVRNSMDADIIAGPIGIILANAILGEVTPKMAEAVGGSDALKVLLPIANCNVVIAGLGETKLSSCVADAVSEILKNIKK